MPWRSNADGNALTIGTGGITVNTTSGNPNVTLAAPINLGGAQTWQNDSSNPLIVSGAVTNGANLLTVQGAGNTTISGAIGGTGGLTKAGAGTLTLSGVNTYTGNTTINASGGTLKIGGTGQLNSGSYNGSIAIGTSGTFNYNSSANQTLSGAVTGTGA